VGHRTDFPAVQGDTAAARGKAFVQKVGVRTDKGSVEQADGFPDQVNRESK
jgi:hypothetical protein